MDSLPRLIKHRACQCGRRPCSSLPAIRRAELAEEIRGARNKGPPGPRLGVAFENGYRVQGQHLAAAYVACAGSPAARFGIQDGPSSPHEILTISCPNRAPDVEQPPGFAINALSTHSDGPLPTTPAGKPPGMPLDPWEQLPDRSRKRCSVGRASGAGAHLHRERVHRLPAEAGISPGALKDQRRTLSNSTPDGAARSRARAPRARSRGAGAPPAIPRGGARRARAPARRCSGLPGPARARAASSPR